MATLQARFFGRSSTDNKQQQPAAPARIPILSTSVGAAVDAFYRSAMNAKLNMRLTGKQAPLFPNMHVQTPIRLLYMNGIKNFRAYLERERPRLLAEGHDAQLVKYGTLFAPGLLMTPFSSILEASNAGHMNPEPMSARWRRGLLPRTLREVIFATGLNQVSDMSREKLVPRAVEGDMTRTFAGSMIAGALYVSVTVLAFAGYVSHVPHNLSTLKLLNPTTSYSTHFASLLNSTVEARLSKTSTIATTPLLRSIAGTALVFLLPKGVFLRTAQIIGSFVIVNGTIALFDRFDVEHKVREYASEVTNEVKVVSKPIVVVPTTASPIGFERDQK